jgi:hypothetical protein
MLRGQDGILWKGTYDLNFNHHTRMKDLRHSADIRCGICRVLFEALKTELESALLPDVQTKVNSALSDLQNYWILGNILRLFYVAGVLNWLRGPYTLSPAETMLERTIREDAAVLNIMDELAVSITASLRVGHHNVANGIRPKEELYQLAFRVRCGQVRCRKIFALTQIGTNAGCKLLRLILINHLVDASDPQFRTPLSRTTSSDEVNYLCQQWITKCKCGAANSQIPAWYPSRLLDVREYKKMGYTKRTLSDPDTSNKVTNSRLVRLVDTRQVGWMNTTSPGSRSSHPRYVTLSHCWGGNPSLGHRLIQETVSKYKAGVRLDELPHTFREAIEFAARLPNVGFIWIDSLCIIQDDDSDWLEESATMEKVYSNTFLNISATDSGNTKGGLFRERDPKLLREEEITLNVAGLPGIDTGETSTGHVHSRHMDSGKRAGLPHLRRCTILDVSFWTRRVDRAPVNRRGWVLQERLMSPRVLHFCKDQVAWECREFDAAEGHPQGMPILQRTVDGIFGKSRVRSLLADLGDAASDSQRSVHALELWGEIVEEYSMTAITRSNDKLIALSGLARLLSSNMRSSQYVAGLWRLHIECQLLWFVKPLFRERDSFFESCSSAPSVDDYRAPSFSWAAVDAHLMRGIKYGDVTNEETLVNVEEATVVQKDGSDLFGVLSHAALILHGKLRHAVIEGPNKKGRYSWKLKGRGKLLNAEEHRNVYLDCPKRDGRITGAGANVFVLPVLRKDQHAPDGPTYLICLLLQLVSTKHAFRRIGLTKLSPWADSEALKVCADGDLGPEILRVSESDVDMPHQGYNPKNGRHRIVLV